MADQDFGYDIREDLDNNYVIVGQSGSTNGDVTGTTEGDGGVWILKINASGTKPGDATFHNPSTTYNGEDYARSLVIDSNTGEYFVSGFTKSYDPQNNDISQLFYYRTPSNFSTFSYVTYGNIDAAKLWDYGSFDLIQLHPTNWLRCELGDGFFSLGVQHPTSPLLFIRLLWYHS